MKSTTLQLTLFLAGLVILGVSGAHLKKGAHNHRILTLSDKFPGEGSAVIGGSNVSPGSSQPTGNTTTSGTVAAETTNSEPAGGSTATGTVSAESTTAAGTVPAGSTSPAGSAGAVPGSDWTLPNAGSTVSATTENTATSGTVPAGSTSSEPAGSSTVTGTVSAGSTTAGGTVPAGSTSPAGNAGTVPGSDWTLPNAGTSAGSTGSTGESSTNQNESEEGSGENPEESNESTEPSDESASSSSTDEVLGSLGTVNPVLSDALDVDLGEKKDPKEVGDKGLKDVEDALSVVEETLDNASSGDDEEGGEEHEHYSEQEEPSLQEMHESIWEFESIISELKIRGVELVSTVRQLEDKLEVGEYLLEFLKDVKKEGSEYLFSKLQEIIHDEDIRNRVLKYQQEGENPQKIRADILTELIALRQDKGHLEEVISWDEFSVILLESIVQSIKGGLQAYRDLNQSQDSETLNHVYLDLEDIYWDYFELCEENENNDNEPVKKDEQIEETDYNELKFGNLIKKGSLKKKRLPLDFKKLNAKLKHFLNKSKKSSTELVERVNKKLSKKSFVQLKSLNKIKASVSKLKKNMSKMSLKK